MTQTVSRTDVITRDQLIRAISAVKRSLPDRATGAEALEGLANEIDSPHVCAAAYEYADGTEGPCETCWEPV